MNRKLILGIDNNKQNRQFSKNYLSVVVYDKLRCLSYNKTLSLHINFLFLGVINDV
jgi:hypothetical protein